MVISSTVFSIDLPLHAQMSRYLTPSKVGLLALISLYSDSVIPAAAIIPVLSFLVSHLSPPGSQASRRHCSQPQQTGVIDIEAFQKVTIVHASAIPGRTVWDLLVKKLWGINSFDALHVFFDSLSNLLQKSSEEGHDSIQGSSASQSKPILLSRSSPLGVFIRRAQLEFTRLQFYDGITLWKSFAAYREPTLQVWRKRNPTAGRTSFDLNLSENHLGVDDRLTEIAYEDLADRKEDGASVSIEDVERLLNYQVDQMQSKSFTPGQCKENNSANPIDTEMGSRLTDEMRSQFRTMVETGVTVPNMAHYVE